MPLLELLFWVRALFIMYKQSRNASSIRLYAVMKSKTLNDKKDFYCFRFESVTFELVSVERIIEEATSACFKYFIWFHKWSDNCKE